MLSCGLAGRRVPLFLIRSLLLGFWLADSDFRGKWVPQFLIHENSLRFYNGDSLHPCHPFSPWLDNAGSLSRCILVLTALGHVS